MNTKRAVNGRMKRYRYFSPFPTARYQKIVTQLISSCGWDLEQVQLNLKCSPDEIVNVKILDWFRG